MDGWEPFLRLAVAAVAGMVIGFEREVHGHPAGMRTHTLVAVGAALFTITGSIGFTEIERHAGIDPGRIAAQVASGIGFIGAGAILRDGLGVRGITTAATLWLGAALGVAAGAGLYLQVLSATVLVLVLLVTLRFVKPLINRLSLATVVLHLEYEPGNGILGWLLHRVHELDGRVSNLRVFEEGADPEREDRGEERRKAVRTVRRVRVPVTVRDTDKLYHLVEEMESRPGVRSVRLETRSE